MIHKKYTRYEKKEIKKTQVENALHGEGLYLFRNNTNADLTLPRPTKSGIRTVGPKMEFQGDSYYKQFIPSLLRLVKELQSPEQQHTALNEVNMTQQQQQEKLILDQPDMITEQGKIEHVVNKSTPIQKMNEHGKQEKQPDILLNENEEGFVFVQ